MMNPGRSTPHRATGDAIPTIIHVSGHTRPKQTPRRPTRTRSASRQIAQETKTPTGRRGRRRSKPESDDERVPPSVLTSWLGEDEEMGDAEGRSSSTDSERSEGDDSGAKMDAGGLSSPTKAAVARKTKTKAVHDGVLPRAPTPALESFVNQTAFDVYFSHANRKLHATSSKHVLSALVEPLSKDEYKTLIARSDGANRHAKEIERLNAEHPKWFAQYALELAQGFNLCFYGYGSKRATINAFAKSKCATRGHVVVINGYIPSLHVKDILGAIEQVPGLGLADTTRAGAGMGMGGGTGIEGQTKRIYDFFRNTHKPALYLIVHNIDAPALRDAKARAVLATLALHPRIHLVASVDSIHAPLLWSTAEVGARKHTHHHHPTTTTTEKSGSAGVDPGAGASTGAGEVPSARGYAWVFHDLTTCIPYDEEIAASRDVTALPGPVSGASAGAGAGGLGDVGAGGPLTEVAVGHVLASVTEKAKELFRLLGTHQLAAIAGGAGVGSGSGVGGGIYDDDGKGASGMDRYGMQYDLLFQVANKQFIATNDTKLRALLGEFIDHGVVVSVHTPGHPDVLWIPASRETLQRILKRMGDAS